VLGHADRSQRLLLLLLLLGRHLGLFVLLD
jgi:hypothetical protein